MSCGGTSATAPSARPGGSGTSRSGSPAADTGRPSWLRGSRRHRRPSPARRAASPPARSASALRPTATARAARASGAAARRCRPPDRAGVTLGRAAQRGAVLLVGAPGGHGGERRFRKRIGERQEDGDALHRAGIHERDELVIEAAELGPVLRLHQRDRHVHGVDSGVPAEVIGDVLADADHARRTRGCARSWLRSGRRSRGRRGRRAWRAPGRPRASARSATSSSSCAGSSVEARMTSGWNSSICPAK